MRITIGSDGLSFLKNSETYEVRDNKDREALMQVNCSLCLYVDIIRYLVGATYAAGRPRKRL